VAGIYKKFSEFRKLINCVNFEYLNNVGNALNLIGNIVNCVIMNLGHYGYVIKKIEDEIVN
jgi:hypothetical protein